MKTILATLALLAAMPATAALADVECTVSPEKRQSLVTLAEVAEDLGWTVEEMEIDDGCYELRVTDQGGNVLKVKIDPETLDVIGGRIKRFAPGAPTR